MNTGYSNNSIPSLNGLIDISADTITTSSVATDIIVLNGVDVSTQLNQVPINTNNITALQQITTGITYSNAGSVDLTTIDNNVTITNTSKIKCATVPTATDDVTNKAYVDTAISNLVNSAPASLDTLNELATAMGNDANFSTTVLNSLATKASLTANQTISGVNTMSNTSNVYYGSGANLTSINSTAVATTNLGINQIVPLINSSTATAGNYQLNIGTALNRNILFNNATGAMTVTKYFGDGSSLSNLPTNIILTSLGANQVVPLVNTSTATAGNYQLSIGADYNKNILFNNVTGALTATKYFGDGSSLTGIALPATALTTNTAQTITSTGSKTFANSSIIMNDGTANATTIKQNSVYNSIDFTQNYNGGKYNFTSKTVAAVDKTCSFENAQCTVEGLNLRDSIAGIEQIRHTFESPTYTIENTKSGGDIKFNCWNTGGTILSTPLTINSTNCTFTQPPLCAIAPTTANMLCNKTYVDGFVTIGTTQTAIAGQKSFTNASNSYSGSGANLTGVVLTTGNQTAAGIKTFTGDIVLSDGGSNTSTIDQNANFFNISNNTLNNTITTITGLIPSQNLQCIVRTDAVGVVTGYAAVSGINITGGGQNSPYSNNFFVVGSNVFTAGITITAVNQIQSDAILNIGAYMTTFIGTRFSLGTYVTADLGLGVYSITPNALVASAAKASTGTAFIALNRPFSAAAAAASITLDYNDVTNIQCPNSSSVMLNAISVKSKSSTSQVDMYGDLKLQGQLQYNYGGTISTTQTLTLPLSQFYLVTTSAAITITLPTASAVLTGTLLIFKRYAQSVGVSTINQTGGGSNLISYNALVPATSIAWGAATYQLTFISAGVYWFLISLQL